MPGRRHSLTFRAQQSCLPSGESHQETEGEKMLSCAGCASVTPTRLPACLLLACTHLRAASCTSVSHGHPAFPQLWPSAFPSQIHGFLHDAPVIVPAPRIAQLHAFQLPSLLTAALTRSALHLSHACGFLTISGPYGLGCWAKESGWPGQDADAQLGRAFPAFTLCEKSVSFIKSSKQVDGVCSRPKGSWLANLCMF